MKLLTATLVAAFTGLTFAAVIYAGLSLIVDTTADYA